MARLPESERKRIEGCRPYGRFLPPRQCHHLIRDKVDSSPIAGKRPIGSVVCDLPVDMSFRSGSAAPASRDIDKCTCIRCLVAWWKWQGYGEGVPQL